MAHKLAHYVATFLPDRYTPDVCEGILVEVAEGKPWSDRDVFGTVGYFLPKTEDGWDLNRWWDELIKQRRERIKRELIEEYGERCECCEERLGTDLHEVFEPRSSDMSWRQIFLFALWNCALVCRECHKERIYSDEFREKIKERRRLFAKGGA